MLTKFETKSARVKGKCQAKLATELKLAHLADVVRLSCVSFLICLLLNTFNGHVWESPSVNNKCRPSFNVVLFTLIHMINVSYLS